MEQIDPEAGEIAITDEEAASLNKEETEKKGHAVTTPISISVNGINEDGNEVIDKEASVPVSIMKSSSPTYEESIEEVKGKKQTKGKEQSLQSTKVVPFWYLFRFATPLDMFMIIIGIFMAIASGLALPGHMLMFGDIIDFFIAYDIAGSLRSGNNFTCTEYQASFDAGNFSFDMSNGTEYFCDQQDREESNVFRYLSSCNLGDMLRSDVAMYSYYYLALAGGLVIAAFFAICLWNWAAYRQTRKMRSAFFKAILQQDIGWFDVSPSSELNTRLSDDIEKIQAGIGDKAAIFILYFSTFVAGFVIAFATNWRMTLVVGTILPLLAFLTGAVAKIVSTFTVREQNAYATAGGIAEEALSAIKTVVAFGGEQKEVDRYEVFLDKAKAVGKKKGFFTGLVTGTLFLVVFCGYGLGFWYGATLIADCDLNPGKVVTVFFGVVIGSFSLGNALPEIQTFAIALGSATAVFAVIDRVPEIDSSSDEGDTLDDLKGNIEFKDVCFTYPARPDIQVMNGLDLQIKVGQTVALVGPSGCGKSTVVQLLQRFYNPSAGQISIDGKNIAELNLKWLRNNIGIVSQEPVLFDTTIRENIRYGNKEYVSDDQIQAAAKAANAYNFITTLPQGFDTPVGQRGTQLSGGQKQRIAIARALVRDPKILLLDEATSALDTESEKIVQEALDKAREGRTTIVIAHRLSTVQTADVIAGIENGRVVEIGSHAELMKKQGLYFELVTAQTILMEEELSEDNLSQFKAAIRRSDSKHSHLSLTKRNRSTHSTSSHDDGSSFQRQASNQSGNMLTALSDQFSRYSIEDLPLAAHPSPALGRKVQSQENTVNENGEIIVKGGKKTMIIRPMVSNEKGVTFDPATDEIKEIPSKKKWLNKKRKNSKEELLSDADPLVDVTFKELLLLNKPDWLIVLIGVLSSAILGTLFPMMSILFSGLLDLFSNLNREELLQGAAVYAGYFVLLAVAACVVQFTSVFTLSLAGERLTQRLRLKTFSAMLRQEMSWYDKKSNSTGALTSRLAIDASDVKGATGLRLGTVLQTVAGVIAALTIALEASWLLTFVLFCVFPFFVVIGIAQIKLLQGRSNKNKLLAAESSKTANEAIDSIRTVASLGIEDKFLEKYEEQLRPPFISNMKSVMIQGTVFGVAQASIFFIYSAGFTLGAYQVVQDPSSPIYASYDAVFRVFAAVVFTALSIGRASSFAPDAQKAQLSASRIMTLLRRKPEIDGYDKDGIKPDNTHGTVTLNNVYFNYPARPEVPVLQGLNVAVHPGETLALVGPSGCGKSTVVSLVERFYDIAAGCIEIDQHDVRDLNIRWLRSQIGIVSQEPVLFDRTIADNIRYGANFRDVNDDEVIEAAKAANINNFIQTLPEGYNTNVGSKGTQLSGGQKQRIAIARALVRDPKILLLDEATSALDTESEKIVQEALDKAREGRTCIVIAHRLSTIYNSNCISVIHNGMVLEKGTHAELMTLGGAYYLLNTVQKTEEEEVF